MSGGDVESMVTRRALAAAATREVIRRELARREMTDFANFIWPPAWRANWHDLMIARQLDKVLQGECKRLMIFAPPRHHKSEWVSRLMPALAFGRNPDAHVIAASYNADLAHDMSRDVQRIMGGERYRLLFPDMARTHEQAGNRRRGEVARVGQFSIATARGLYRAVGVGGGVVGRGGDLIIIDDPFKSRAEAESIVIRDKTHDWFKVDMYSRLEPDGAIVLMHQRWHEDDLAGRLLRAAADGEGEPWTVLCLPATFDPEHPNRHPNDPRDVGEPLYPAAFGADRLADIRRMLGPYDWEALYQQRPAPAEGAVFRREWLTYYDREDEPALNLADHFVTADLASGKKDGDYTVMMVWAVAERLGRKDLVLREVVRGHLTGPQMIRTLTSLQDRWNPVFAAVEKVAWQLAIMQQAIADGVRVRWVIPDTDKRSRALAVTPLFEQGQVLFPSFAPWLGDLEHELLSFRGAGDEVDDQVDNVAYAGRVLTEMIGSVLQPEVVKGHSKLDAGAAPWHDKGDGAAPWRDRNTFARDAQREKRGR